MSWAMNDEAVKVQMFRFVDVLPMLKDHHAIARHLDEYFEDVRDRLPWAARVGLDLSVSNTILSRSRIQCPHERSANGSQIHCGQQC